MKCLNQILKPVILGGGVLLAGVNAFALTDGPCNVVFPIGGGNQALNFNSTMTLPKFNVGGGILQSISLTLTGNLTASQKFENTSGGGDATISLQSLGTMTLQHPHTTTSVITVPTVTNPQTVTANAGNLIAQFNTSGSITAFVTYNFSVAAAVPETSTYGSIGAVAIVGLLGCRRARSSEGKVP